ncbi:MAG: hypothetical protein OER85_06230 [Gammaproteobacteria bacterium]|nr:hypothetical protein [Gammaproteobacteria bacterium]
MLRLLNFARATWIFAAASVAGVGIFAFSIGRLMLPHSAPLGARIGEMTCLQLVFTSEAATNLILSFSPEAQAAMLKLLVPGDLTFAWSYGLILFGLVGLLVLRLNGSWRRIGVYVMWFPLAASLLDSIEDIFLFNIVSAVIDDPGIQVPAILPLLASTAATLKYLFLCLLTPIFAVAGVIQGLRSDRSIGAWIIYVLLIYAVGSIVVRPLQQIPACF